MFLILVLSVTLFQSVACIVMFLMASFGTWVLRLKKSIVDFACPKGCKDTLLLFGHFVTASCINIGLWSEELLVELYPIPSAQLFC